jgi:hypothetical protein
MNKVWKSHAYTMFARMYSPHHLFSHKTQEKERESLITVICHVCFPGQYFNLFAIVSDNIVIHPSANTSHSGAHMVVTSIYVTVKTHSLPKQLLTAKISLTFAVFLIAK